MARKTIFVSDLTGKAIDEKSAATLAIRYADARQRTGRARRKRCGGGRSRCKGCQAGPPGPPPEV